ncbi:TPA: excinuclease ABC subunit UvrA [Listeria monocytogenes]|nr:excinuclease ABC subunit UvrA [Listeria monocytogenes serotype 4b]EHC6186547.1 excinuclease ABC subunit UvrA [Listeria monocytogenes serotype 1/2a]EHD1271868.1 excinuclease ABC subunit UvrA [Listeria monocytogenes]EHC6224972.1 excinuclease ABC subunit UvrA [Listeria monocytogenes serotype 1/2a]EHD1628225.1 excinuclease ABC subunit UvrA [Listeria monocytogenes]
MVQEYIRLRGARENNLQNISLDIPKRKITIFTGVSGSGKSSIVFETIATESQRQLNETYSAYLRNFLPKYTQPDADSIENLSTSVIIDQKRLGGNSRSTLGTITDINSILRLLFSRVGKPSIGTANLFSFNDPAGMCPDCHGVGQKVSVDLVKLLDPNKSLKEGAILFPTFSVDSWYWNSYAYSGFFDVNKKIKDYTDEEYDMLLHGKDIKVFLETPMGSMNATYEGLIPKFNRLYIQKEGEMSASTKKRVDKFTHIAPCTTCEGTRLSAQALSCKINGANIADFTAMQLDELKDTIARIDDPIATPMVKSVTERLQHLIDIGLGYMTLDRQTASLSGGESQRVKMIRHLNSSLTDLLYIFDEPSIGLHPRDVHRLNELLVKLRDKGNTILVVEHDPDVIKIADHVVDVGPHAGKHGGEIQFVGSYTDLLKSDTLTGQFLNRHLPINSKPRQPKGFLTTEKSSRFNLKNIQANIPKEVLTVITGVAGSGKSTLIHSVFLKEYPDAIVIDQSAAHANIRSNPATYTGIMDPIRKAFGKENDVSPSLFSYNSKGACENCKGLGFTTMDLAFMDSIRTPCEVCHGKRFQDSVLQFKLNGKSISDVLELTVSEALDFFTDKKILKKIEAMEEVGIGYVTLGQALSTLSGGECQRLKLANELHKKGSIYIMDEPTTGLHMSDIEHILTIIHSLVNKGNTVIVIEHNVDIIRNADWIIDLGPEGGSAGGQIIFEGAPLDLLENKQSLTAKYL